MGGGGGDARQKERNQWYYYYYYYSITITVLVLSRCWVHDNFIKNKKERTAPESTFHCFRVSLISSFSSLSVSDWFISLYLNYYITKLLGPCQLVFTKYTGELSQISQKQPFNFVSFSQVSVEPLQTDLFVNSLVLDKKCNEKPVITSLMYKSVICHECLLFHFIW